VSVDHVFLLIAILSAAYAFFSTMMTQVYGNRARVKEIQERMKRINQEHAAALRSGDRDALARAEKAQSEELPALLKESMVLQFKPMLPTLALFFLLFYYALPSIAPDANDDVRLTLFDDGLPEHCDSFANDSVFSNCYKIPAGAPNGTWVASAKAVRTGSFLFFPSEEKLGENSTLFLVGAPSIEERLPSLPQHNYRAMVILQADKTSYSRGEMVSISARVTGDGFEKVVASLDSGTRYWVDSTVDIPFLGKELHPTGLFILLIIISSLLLQLLISLHSRLKR